MEKSIIQGFSASFFTIRPVVIAWLPNYPRATMLQMPIDHILSLLISERDKLTRAIEVLQGTSRGGRPRKHAVPATDATPTKTRTRKRDWTPAMKRAAAERANAMWVRRRKQAGKKG